MVPFRDNGHLTETEIKYNKIHSSSRARMIIEKRSLGFLKGFRSILDTLPITRTDLIYTIYIYIYIYIYNERSLEHTLRSRALLAHVAFLTWKMINLNDWYLVSRSSNAYFCQKLSFRAETHRLNIISIFEVESLNCIITQDFIYSLTNLYSILFISFPSEHV